MIIQLDSREYLIKHISLMLLPNMQYPTIFKGYNYHFKNGSTFYVTVQVYWLYYEGLIYKGLPKLV